MATLLELEKNKQQSFFFFFPITVSIFKILFRIKKSWKENAFWT